MLAATDAMLARTDARLGGYEPRLRATLDGWGRSLSVWPASRFHKRESHRVWRAELFVKRKEVLHKQKPHREWPKLPREYRTELFAKRNQPRRKQKPHREWPKSCRACCGSRPTWKSACVSCGSVHLPLQNEQTPQPSQRFPRRRRIRASARREQRVASCRSG